MTGTSRCDVLITSCTRLDAVAKSAVGRTLRTSEGKRNGTRPTAPSTNVHRDDHPHESARKGRNQDRSQAPHEPSRPYLEGRLSPRVYDQICRSSHQYAKRGHLVATTRSVCHVAATAPTCVLGMRDADRQDLGKGPQGRGRILMMYWMGDRSPRHS